MRQIKLIDDNVILAIKTTPMKAKDKPKYISELRKIISKIDVNKLIISPDEELNRQGIMRTRAIFTNFDYGTGVKLKTLIDEFLEVARAGKRTQHIENLANNIKNFIIEKTEEIEVYKLKKNKGPISKSYIFYFLLGSIILILVIFFDWRPSGISFGPLKFGSPKESIIQPDLQFDNVEFIYYDLEEKPIHNEPGIKYIMNLNEVSMIGFVGTIKNTGNVNLLISLKNFIMETSEGQIVYNEPPFRPVDNSPLVAGDSATIRMKAIKSSWLLEALKIKENFSLIFKPKIEYFVENAPEEKYNFDEVVICGNNYSGDLLPQFAQICHSEKR